MRDTKIDHLTKNRRLATNRRSTQNTVTTEVNRRFIQNNSSLTKFRCWNNRQQLVSEQNIVTQGNEANDAVA